MIEKLAILTDNLNSKMKYAAVSNVKVSAASVGWHIDHILLTTNTIINAIENSNPSEYKSKFSLAKLYVFSFNKIPRGRIQSPKAVTPKQNFTIEDINQHFEICCTLIEKLNHLNADNFFIHPFFGHVNLKSSIKFLEIHTKHHLNIIDDILKAEAISV